MKKNKEWPRAIFLDFYGTVVEEDGKQIGQVCDEIAAASSKSVTKKEVSSYWAKSFSKICYSSHGITFKSEGKLEKASLEEVMQHFDADLDSDRLVQSIYDYWTHPTIFPESREVIDKCEVPICLVSNIDNADLASALKHTNLSFDPIITSEDCKAYKPRPEPFEKALAAMGLSNHEVLHVGDSLSSDIRGARAMGIPVLWINRKGREVPPGDESPDYISAFLTGILDAIKMS